MTTRVRIFISYRGGEGYADEHVARELYYKLSEEFGAEAVFRDIDDSHLMVSQRFREVLTKQLALCTHCVVVVGPKWIEDIPRLHNSDDFVRMEVFEVINRIGVGVIPVMIGGAETPNRPDLPDDIKDLFEFGGLSYSSEYVESSIKRLIDALKPYDPWSRKWWVAAFATALSALVYLLWMPFEPNEDYLKTRDSLVIFNEALDTYYKEVERLD